MPDDLRRWAEPPRQPVAHRRSPPAGLPGRSREQVVQTDGEPPSSGKTRREATIGGAANRRADDTKSVRANAAMTGADPPSSGVTEVPREAEAAVGDEDRAVEVRAGVAEHEQRQVDDVGDRPQSPHRDPRREPLAGRPRNRRRAPSVSPIGPGAIALTRMPSGPHSTARVRVSASTAALAAATWTWPGVPP